MLFLMIYKTLKILFVAVLVVFMNQNSINPFLGSSGHPQSHSNSLNISLNCQ